MALRNVLAGRGRREMRPYRSLQAEINDLFDQAWFGVDVPGVRGAGDMLTRFTPEIDVSETKKEIRVTADLPGMDAKDVEVEVSGRILTIRGEKKEEREEKERDFHLVERSHGTFHRSIELPEGADTEKVDATFENGVMTIVIRKTAAAEKAARKIAIKARK